ncbi:MAG: c-type cytochrome [Ignavibacteriales bacterium]|nr:MAG: c-type cytochrome [Ignavibacteriales bacterium]
MNFLDSLVLPQSAEHIELLHYMLMLILFLFIPFISIEFGGTFLSLLYKRKAVKYGNELYLKFAKDIIDTVTINKSVGVILGIMPLLTIIIIFAQLLHKSGVMTVSILSMSLLFEIVGLILIYSYKYSLSFNNIFDSLKNVNISDPSVDEDIKKLSRGTFNLSVKAGRYGFLFLLAAIWLFVSGFTLALYPGSWENQNIFSVIFSAAALIRLLSFASAALALTGGTILFVFFYWDGGKQNLNPEYSDYVKTQSIKVTFSFSILIPLFIFINLIFLPVTAVSGFIFLLAVIGMLLLFLAYHYLYAMIRNGELRFSGHLFFALLFSIIAIIVQDQLAMGNATELQSKKLSSEYEVHLAELKGTDAGVEKLNGKEIYDVRCAACHRFDVKLVGPAHKDVLPKYEGKLNQLVAFIRNPVKVDPAFPPMPNPGLKPQEAQAVAEYLLEEMKKK